MGRPPLRNTGNVKKVESAVSKDRRHTVHYLAEITGLGKSNRKATGTGAIKRQIPLLKPKREIKK